MVTGSQATVCNLDETRASATAAVGNSSGELGRAASFVTGPDQYTLRSAHIAFTGVTGDPGDLAVSIHRSVISSGISGVGEVIGTLSGAKPSGAGVHEFTTSGIALEPETEYWLELRASDADDGNYYAVAATSSTSESAATAGWSIGNSSLVYIGAIEGHRSSDTVGALAFAVIADSALRLKLRVFLESALP